MLRKLCLEGLGPPEGNIIGVRGGQPPSGEIHWGIRGLPRPFLDVVFGGPILSMGRVDERQPNFVNSPDLKRNMCMNMNACCTLRGDGVV